MSRTRCAGLVDATVVSMSTRPSQNSRAGHQPVGWLLLSLLFANGDRVFPQTNQCVGNYHPDRIDHACFPRA